MKTYDGMGVQLHAYLIFSLDGGGPSASITGLFIPGKTNPGTHSRELRWWYDIHAEIQNSRI
jgi:hypothetical protein